MYLQYMFYSGMKNLHLYEILGSLFVMFSFPISHSLYGELA